MKLENTVGFRISMYDCKDPQLFVKQLTPANYIKRVWTPQTVADQIWVWFEFTTLEEKEAYIEWVKGCDVSCDIGWILDKNITKAYPKDMFMELNQDLLDYWSKPY